MKKKIIRTQEYTITINHYEDGTCTMTRKSKNLLAYELLGILYKTSLEVAEQISGKMTPPTEVKRIVVKPENK